jgi:hypothetical protein
VMLATFLENWIEKQMVKGLAVFDLSLPPG